MTTNYRHLPCPFTCRDRWLLEDMDVWLSRPSAFKWLNRRYAALNVRTREGRACRDRWLLGDTDVWLS